MKPRTSRTACARRESLTRALALTVWLAAQLCGCVAERSVEATEIVVSVDSDLDLTALHTIQVDVADPRTLRVVGTRSYEVVAHGDGNGKVVLPFSFTIDRGRRDDVRVVVTGFGPSASGSRSPHRRPHGRRALHRSRDAAAPRLPLARLPG